MNISPGVVAFCALYGISDCSPTNVSRAAVDQLGQPYDKVTWCCGTLFSRGEQPSWVELQKPHTAFCDHTVVVSADQQWDFMGSIPFNLGKPKSYQNYCALWLRKGTAKVS